MSWRALRDFALTLLWAVELKGAVLLGASYLGASVLLEGGITLTFTVTGVPHLVQSGSLRSISEHIDPS